MIAPSNAGVFITSIRKATPGLYYEATTPYMDSLDTKSTNNYYESSVNYPESSTEGASDVYARQQRTDSGYSRLNKRVLPYNSQTPYVYTSTPTPYYEERAEKSFEPRDFTNQVLEASTSYYRPFYVTETPVYETEAGEYFTPYYYGLSFYPGYEYPKYDVERSSHYVTEPYSLLYYPSSEEMYAYEADTYPTFRTPSTAYCK